MTYPKEWLGVKCNCFEDCPYQELELVDNIILDNEYVQCISNDDLICTGYFKYDELIPLTPAAKDFLAHMKILI